MSTTKKTEVETAEAITPSLASSVAAFESSRMETKRLLDGQPKKQIRLRAAAKDQPNYETCCVNGYIYQIMRGVEVAVPQTVYDILDEAGII